MEEHGSREADRLGKEETGNNREIQEIKQKLGAYESMQRYHQGKHECLDRKQENEIERQERIGKARSKKKDY